MISRQQWPEEICNDKIYKKLYAVGMEITRDDPEIRDAIPDAIQDVFLLLCKRYLVLIQHDSIEGWLVVALKYRLMDIKKSYIRSARHASFSLDDEDRQVDRLKAEAANSLTCQTLFDLIEEKLEAIEESIGPENMRLLEAYYYNTKESNEIAQSLGISSSALRKRVSRICMQIRAMNMMTIIFFLIKSQTRL